MSNEFSKVDIDRKILADAQARGSMSTLGAFFRLSGPGWLQAAITLGGGSLGSALYLGMLGGTQMLWLQLLAITVGVIMLSAISYVTLSTGERPYKSINEHINPVLGVGWIIATMLANMIWVMPQFSLCFEVLENNLLPGRFENNKDTQLMVSGGILVAATILLLLSAKGGKLSRLFDLFLKLIVGMIVICFVGVVVVLFRKADPITAEVFKGFIPDISQLWNPAPEVQALIDKVPEARQEVWTESVKTTQLMPMVSAVATAVGINMTFLLPYSMLNRGWDKPFRGLARFDLITGMAIPFILVTSCIVIASSHSFYTKADKALLSESPATIQTSSFLGGVTKKVVAESNKKWPAGTVVENQSELAEVSEAAKAFSIAEAAEKTAKAAEKKDEAAIKAAEKAKSSEVIKKKSAGEYQAAIKAAEADKAEKAKVRDVAVAIYLSKLSVEERKLHAALVKPSGKQLAKSLEPLLGEKNANLVFGLGALGMGFSTIIVLMMINGFAFRELLGQHDNQWVGIAGALVAGLIGLTWPWVWAGESKTWVIILASLFGAMLLPIAYFTFMMMMNSSRLLGDDKPTGIRMLVWNVLMIFGVFVAVVNAYLAVSDRIKGDYGEYILGALGCFVLMAVIGFSARSKSHDESLE